MERELSPISSLARSFLLRQVLLPLLGDGVCEKTSDRSKLPVQVESVFNIDFLALGFGVLNNSNDHFMRVLRKQGEHVDTQRKMRVDTISPPLELAPNEV